MVRAKVFSVVVCQAHGIPEYFPFLDSDDRLENTFGMQRVMECGRNFDAVQFEERGGELMRLGKIYERNPEWKRSARRLTGRIHDHCNPRTMLKGGRPPVDVSAVNLPTIYKLGSELTVASLSGVVASEHCAYAALAAGGATLLKPMGEYVGVSTEELDDDEPEEEPPPPMEEGVELEDLLHVDPIEAPVPATALQAPVPAAAAPSEAQAVPAAVAIQAPAPEAAVQAPIPAAVQAPILAAVQAPILAAAPSGAPVAAAAAAAVVRTLTDFPGYTTISAEHATKLYFAPSGSKSSERINRVMNRLKAGTRAVEASALNESDCDPRAGGLHADLDPILVLVQVPAGVSCVIAIPLSFTSPPGEKGLDVLSVAEFKSARSFVRCRLLQAIQKPGPEGIMTFAKDVIGEEFVTSGDLCSPFNPETRTNEANGSFEWCVKASSFTTAAVVMCQCGESAV